MCSDHRWQALHPLALYKACCFSLRYLLATPLKFPNIPTHDCVYTSLWTCNVAAVILEVRWRRSLVSAQYFPPPILSSILSRDCTLRLAACILGYMAAVCKSFVWKVHLCFWAFADEQWCNGSVGDAGFGHNHRLLPPPRYGKKRTPCQFLRPSRTSAQKLAHQRQVPYVAILRPWFENNVLHHRVAQRRP